MLATSAVCQVVALRRHPRWKGPNLQLSDQSQDTKSDQSQSLTENDYTSPLN